jgi:nucleotide-binding universal stress UspA family protein
MRLLVAIDFVDTTDRLLRVADQIAKAMSASVHLLHVAEPDPSFAGYDAGPAVVRGQVAHEYQSQRQQLQAHADVLRASGIDTSMIFRHGPIAEIVLAEAAKLPADLIVMGTHGRSALHDAVVGSVSHAVLRSVQVPVLLVPVTKI